MSPPAPPSADPPVTNAADSVISLSQALLAPMDAILKAQVHAARSFLNLVLQLGFPHREGGAAPVASGAATTGAVSAAKVDAGQETLPYTVPFYYDLPNNGGRQQVNVPTLALVPITPLAITSASFEFDFFVRATAQHQQLRAAVRNAEPDTRDQNAGVPPDTGPRPWYLVADPVSLRGTVAPGPGDAGAESSQRAQESRLSIKVQVAQMPVPAALERLLAGLAQSTSTSTLPAPQTPGPTPNTNPATPSS